MKAAFTTVDEYIALQPVAIQPLLETIRQTIKSVAPEAEECLSYQMPAYKLKGPLVYFAAYKNHIGFYPTGSGIKAFENDITAFKHSKGAVQFPLDQPLPVDLIQKMVQFKINENLTKIKK